MGLGPVVDVILDHIATIDYGYTNTTCSLFETTIRYLGGMLAGYDLLTGPFEGLASNVGTRKCNRETRLTELSNSKPRLTSCSASP